MTTFNMKLLVLSALVALTAAAPRLAPPVPKPIFAEDGYIIGGEEASPGQFPFQAALLASSSRSGSVICGGVYIGRRWILNAAHCTLSSARSILLGLHNRTDVSTAQHFTLTRIVNHPDFNEGPGAFPNDISVLEMSGAPDTSVDTVGAADLAEGSDDFAGHTATISGWGRTCGSCPHSDVLLFAETTVLPNYGDDSCESDWEDNVNNGHICVKSREETTGPCSSDSGGPVSIGNKVLGVHSWGPSGCETSYPSAYSRVTYFRDWIREITGI